MKTLRLNVLILALTMVYVSSAQEKKTIQFDNGDRIKLKDGNRYKIEFVSGAKRKGKVFLLENGFVLSPFVPPVFHGEDKAQIEKLGINIDGNSYEPKHLVFVNDSMLVLKSEVFAYDEIKYVNAKGKKEPFELRKYNFSIGLNGTHMNTSSMSKEMQNAGLNGTKFYQSERTILVYNDGAFYASKESHYSEEKYPKAIGESMQMDLDLSYHFNSRHGIMYNYAGYYSRSFQGFKELDVHFESETNHSYSYNTGLELIMNINVSNHSITYVHSLLNQRLNLVVGPSLAMVNHNFHINGSLNERSGESNGNLWGALFGGSFNIIHRKFWFINVKSYYKWYPQQYVIGPQELFGLNEHVQFGEVPLSLNSFTIGFGVGLRL